MQYQEAVTEARALVKRSEDDQWRLAQLTYEQVEAGKSRRQWAKDVGVHSSTADRWYLMWERWGAGQAGIMPKFQDAYSALRSGDGVEPEEAPSVRHQEMARGAIRNMPPEQKAEVARELLAEPTVAREVVRDPRTSSIVSEAQTRERVEREQRVERMAQEHSPGAREHEKFLTARHLLHNARSNVALSLDSGREANLNDPQRRDLENDLADLEAAISLYRAMLAGEAGFEHELAALLESER